VPDLLHLRSPCFHQVRDDALPPDELLFPVSGRLSGGKERKAHKMMQHDLEAARMAWLKEAYGADARELKKREASDFLNDCNSDRLTADFDLNRHMPPRPRLERAGLSPKMAPTLARHSDVRLTPGVSTHVGLHDQTAAIGPLPSPIQPRERKDEVRLKATRTETPRGAQKWCPYWDRVVPKMVPDSSRRTHRSLH
jgi:hypothetical protein